VVQKPQPVVEFVDEIEQKEADEPVRLDLDGHLTGKKPFDEPEKQCPEEAP
jgi:hypothetical protein